MTKKSTYTIIKPDGSIQETEENKAKFKKTAKSTLYYADLGLYFAAPLLICIAVGIFLDKIVHTKPQFTIIFIIIGTIATFYNLIKLIHDDPGRKNTGNDSSK